MADFATAFHARLIADSAVSAVVGTKVYPVIVPQGKARPYVRYQVVSDPRPEHLTGYDSSRVSRIQVDVFADSYGAARSLSESIIAAVAQPATVGGINFGRTKAEGPRDLGEDVEGVGYVHRLSMDLLTEHSLA